MTTPIATADLQRAAADLRTIHAGLPETREAIVRRALGELLVARMEALAALTEYMEEQVQDAQETAR